MMRTLLFLPLAALAACSNSTAEPTVQAPEPAAMLDAGQWDAASTVATLAAMDAGKPAIATPPGTRAAASACVGESDRKKPDPAVLTGLTDQCEYRDVYVGNGRITASLSCTRPGLDGALLVAVDGDYTATTLAADVSINTALAGSGDVRITTKVVGKRVGACAAG